MDNNLPELKDQLRKDYQSLRGGLLNLDGRHEAVPSSYHMEHVPSVVGPLCMQTNMHARNLIRVPDSERYILSSTHRHLLTQGDPPKPLDIPSGPSLVEPPLDHFKLQRDMDEDLVS